MTFKVPFKLKNPGLPPVGVSSYADLTTRSANFDENCPARCPDKRNKSSPVSRFVVRFLKLGLKFRPIPTDSKSNGFCFGGPVVRQVPWGVPVIAASMGLVWKRAAMPDLNLFSF
jgi:hypothetical protein